MAAGEPADARLRYAHDPAAYEAEEWSRPDEMALFNLLWTTARQVLDERPGCRVLDVCCGTGLSLLGAISHPHVALAVGVDVAAPLLAFARRRYAPFGNVSHVRADAVDLIFAPGTFDLVVASSAYHHIEHERKRAFLGTCHAVLRAGGRLLMAENVLPPYDDDGEAYDRAVRTLYAAVTRTARDRYPRLPPSIRAMLDEDVALSVRREHEFKVDRRRLLADVLGAGFVVESEQCAWAVDPRDPGGSGGNSLLVLRKGPGPET